MLTIFKGDDTGGLLGKAVKVTVNTSVDLSGCVVYFDLGGVSRKFEGVHDGDELNLFYSHNETAAFPLGMMMGVLYAVDASGKIRTFTNTIPVKVTDVVAECYGADASQVTVTIRAAVSWGDIANLPLAGRRFDLSDYNGIVAALGVAVEALGGTADA